MNNLIAISEARANLPKLVEDVQENYERAVITVNGKPAVVMMSIEEMESLEETAEILAIPGALESIKEGAEQMKRGEGISFEKLIGKTPTAVLKSKKRV